VDERPAAAAGARRHPGRCRPRLRAARVVKHRAEVRLALRVAEARAVELRAATGRAAIPAARAAAPAAPAASGAPAARDPQAACPANCRRARLA
jgi:hypothetical protein